MTKRLEKSLRGDLIVMPADPRGSDAQFCLDAYFTELASRFTGGFDRDTDGADKVGNFAAPSGCMLLAHSKGAPIGCGALRTFEPGIGEIKRMWVSPAARGIGLGRRLLEELERVARQLKMRAVRLDSNKSLGEAIRLYRASGYLEIDPFNDNPYAQLWFEKDLT